MNFGLAWVLAELAKFISQWVPVASPFSEDWKVIFTVFWIFLWMLIGLPMFSWDGRRRAKALATGDMDTLRITRYSTTLNATASFVVFIFINQGIILAGIMAILMFTIIYYICKKLEQREIALAKREKEENHNGII